MGDCVSCALAECDTCAEDMAEFTGYESCCCGGRVDRHQLEDDEWDDG